MKCLNIIIAILLSAYSLAAQQYSLGKGAVSFTIATPAGNLKATDSSATGYLQLKTGALFVRCLVDDFQFITALKPEQANKTATERFRHYYLQSDQYPYATFKGKMRQPAKTDLSRDGVYHLNADGMATIHGVTKKVILSVTLTVKNGEILLETAHQVLLSDYQIRTPPEGIFRFVFKEAEVRMCSILKKQ